MLFATFYSQEEHNLTICALWLPDLCHNLICVAHFFLNHHHLYYTNVALHVLADPRFYRIAQIYVFKLGLVGPWGVLHGTSWVEGHE